MYINKRIICDFETNPSKAGALINYIFIKIASYNLNIKFNTK